MIFVAAAVLNFVGAFLHLICIAWGPEGYRFFGAGERMAEMAEQKHWMPPVLTLMISFVLAVWGFYCLALGELTPSLPWMAEIVWAITLVYLIRGIYPFLMARWVAFFRTPFMLTTSGICLMFGVIHALALVEAGQI